MYNPEDNSFQDELKNGSLGPRLIQMLGYTFTMGSDSSPYKHEKPAHEVKVDEFYIGKTTITFDEYDVYCEDTKEKKPNDLGFGRGNLPVVNISWTEATKYCEWLSQQTGKHYRLPTDAEWECACGAGNPFTFWFGNDDSDLKEYAWFFMPNLYKMVERIQPVGQKKPNPWGLYDMHGNVWEWCQDWKKEENRDPIDETVAIVRGGCVLSFSFECATYRRAFWDKEIISEYVGFRIARDRDLL